MLLSRLALRTLCPLETIAAAGTMDARWGQSDLMRDRGKPDLRYHLVKHTRDMASNAPLASQPPPAVWCAECLIACVMLSPGTKTPSLVQSPWFRILFKGRYRDITGTLRLDQMTSITAVITNTILLVLLVLCDLSPSVLYLSSGIKHSPWLGVVGKA